MSAFLNIERLLNHLLDTYSKKGKITVGYTIDTVSHARLKPSTDIVELLQALEPHAKLYFVTPHMDRESASTSNLVEDLRWLDSIGVIYHDVIIEPSSCDIFLSAYSGLYETFDILHKFLAIVEGYEL